MAYGMKNPAIRGRGRWEGDIIPQNQKMGQVQQFTPEQMELFGGMYGDVGPQSYLSRLAGGDQSLFNEIEAPALQQHSALLGNLSSRFSGMGGTGGRRSSGFFNEGNTASANFAQQLQSQRQGLQRQAIGDLWNMKNQLLQQRPYERGMYERAPKKSGWGGAIGAGLGAAGGFMVGGPAGAFQGAQLGYGVGSQF